jgi:hypothetical protein
LANGPAAEQMLSRGDNWNPVLDKKKKQDLAPYLSKKGGRGRKRQVKIMFFYLSINITFFLIIYVNTTLTLTM